MIDQGSGGSSRIAAGMVNPVTGKNFEPSWRIAEFLPEALDFYAEIERELGQKLWHSLLVLRLAASEKEWCKILSKIATPEVAPWVVGEVAAPDGWIGAVEVKGGGRLDTRAFLDHSQTFFAHQGCFEFAQISGKGSGLVHCQGASELLTGKYGPHRCAKGEILTIRAAGWDETQIRVGAGGWLVPQGGGIFRVGSTYEWSELDETPTAKGRLKVEEIANRLGGNVYEVISQETGVRPILRRSQPMIGPLGDGSWMFNALGLASRLVRWMVDGIEPEPDVDFRKLIEHQGTTCVDCV